MPPFTVVKLVADDDGTGLFGAGDTVTYTIRIAPRSENIITGTFNLVDTLPDGLTYLAGSTYWVNAEGDTAAIADNTLGTLFPLDGSNNVIGSSAPLYPGDTLTLGFRAIITAQTDQIITNRVKVWQGNQTVFAEVSMPVYAVTSLGNRVWYDFDRDGYRDAWELGINDVALSLYALRDTNAVPDEQLDTLLVDRDTTAGGGYYLFEEVLEGQYFVALDPGNFADSAAFFRFRTSPVTEFNPNFDVDRNDNGIDLFVPEYGYFSREILLEYGEEPTGEFAGPAGTGGSPDNASNLTLDFGLYEPPPFDLALKKELLSELTPGPFYPGDTVIFLITVENQGNVSARNIRIIDHFPDDLTMISTNWEGIDNWRVTKINGPVLPGAQTSTTIAFRIDSLYTDTVLLNHAEIYFADDDNLVSNGGAVDMDSHYDQDPGNDAGGLPGSAADNALDGDGSGAPGQGDAETDEDDADPELVIVQQPYDLALTKTLAPGQEGPFEVGDTIAFDIALINQGTRHAAGIVIEDRLPDGLAIVEHTSENDLFTAQGDGIFSLSELSRGDTAMLTVFVEITPDFQLTSFINTAEIILDNGNDEDSTPDNGVGAEDDQDQVAVSVVQVYDLALTKALGPGETGPFSPGSPVSFTVTVYNQGTLHAENIRIRDRLPNGMTYVDGSSDLGDVTVLGGALFQIPFLAAGDSVRFTVYTQINDTFQGFSLTNEAEIILDDGNDQDSTPNNDQPAEDDQGQVTFDVEQTFDLSLTKTLAPGQPAGFEPGATVTFLLTLTNEGTLTAYGAQVTDILPPELIYSGSNADGVWVMDLGAGVFAIASLAPGTSRDILVEATVASGYQGFTLTNAAEITADSGPDVDSTPGNGANGEDDYAELVIAIDQTYDLALSKSLAPGQEAGIAPGEPVSFLIIVLNQGTLDAADVSVTDFFPDALSYIGLTGDGLTETGDGAFVIDYLPAGETVTATLTFELTFGFQGDAITNTAEITGDDGEDIDSDPNNGSENEDDRDQLVFPVDHTFDLSLTKALAPGQSDFVPPGEGVAFVLTIVNEGTLDASDIEVADLLPDGLLYTGSDADGTTVIDEDNGRFTIPLIAAGESISITVNTLIDANFLGLELINAAEIVVAAGEDDDSTPGNQQPAEDDWDSIPIGVDQPFDLALSKTLAPGQPAGFAPGEDVAFLLTLVNEGNLPALNTVITDFLPTGLNYAGSDADGAAVVDQGNGQFLVADLPPGAMQSILVTTTVAPGFQGFDLTNTAEITGASDIDIDSSPDNGENEEDDWAEATIEVLQTYDLALTKGLAPGQGGGVVPGETIAFVLTVENEGTLDAGNITVTDFFPPALSYLTSDAAGNQVVDNGDGSFVVNQLPAGQAVSIIATFELAFGFQGEVLSNAAEITAADGQDVDSTPGNNDPDEDDRGLIDFAVTQRFDLSLEKTLAPGQPSPVPPGGAVDFLLTLTNEGTLHATGIQVADLLPGELLYAGSDADGEAVIDQGGGLFAIPYLAAGESVNIAVFTTIDTSYLDFSITNGAEIIAADGQDLDSTPGNQDAGEDDFDQADIAVDQPFDLALRKALAPGQPDGVAPGSPVEFVITVVNEGLVDAYETEVTDFLSPGMTYAGSDADGQSVVDLGDGLFRIPSLAAGDSIAIVLTTAIAFGVQDLALNNVAEITAAQETDEDSTPGNNDYDEDDLGEVRFNIDHTFDLALSKSLSDSVPGPYLPGDLVAFALTVTNEGTLDADSIAVADHLPDNLNYVGADTDGLPVTADGAGHFTVNTLLHGQSLTWLVYAEIAASFDGDSLINTAEIMQADGPDTDSDPGNGEISEDDMAQAILPVTQVFDLALVKQVSPATPGPHLPGDTVVFRLRVFNQGTLDAYNVTITDYLPDGLEVIDPNWTVNGNQAVHTIPGPIFSLGSAALVDLQARIDPDYTLPTIVNVAEISSADDDTDPDNTPPVDHDSPYDQQAGNDGGGQAGAPADNAINGDGTGAPGSAAAETDEDDSDPCLITLCGYDAGQDGFLEVCIGCPQTPVAVDLFGAIGGTPEPGGDWLDVQNTGVDLSDPAAVDLTGLAPGGYTFTYYLGDPDVCSNAQSDVTVLITAVNNLSCNDQINVALGLDCEATVIPEMVVEGVDDCYIDQLEVRLINPQGVDIGNVITGSEAGQTLIADVYDPNCGNYCLGNIVVADLLPPTITCPTNVNDFVCSDADTLLNNAALLAVTGEPDIADNCTTELDLDFSDQFFAGPDCGQDSIVRTFTVTDGSGNAASCIQVIAVRQANPEDIVLPPQSVVLDCAAPFATNDQGLPAIQETGLPAVQTFFGLSALDQTYCNFGAFHEDSPEILFCDGSYTFVRSWTVLDWCDPTTLITLDQVVQVTDNTGPAVSCPEFDYDLDGQADDIFFPSGPFDCTAAFAVPQPMVTDNCSDWEVRTQIVTDTIVEVLNPFGQVIGLDTQELVLATIEPGDPLFVGGIRLGCHRFRYEVTDDCDNTTLLECDFCVEDRAEPIPICDDEITVAIGGQGVGRIFVDDVDEGSWDNCGVQRRSIRRRVAEDPGSCEPVTPFYTVWGEFVDVNCCDIGDTVAVELQIVDFYNNANVCATNVIVVDNVQPLCTPPPATAVDCDALPPDFDPSNPNVLSGLFGQPFAVDNCQGAGWEELPPLVDLDDCGFGSLTRRFRAVDASGNTSQGTCQQVVSIDPVYDYEIRFPADAATSCGDSAPDTISYSENACDLLAVSVTDMPFTPAGDECYEILRTYRVINWCEYDGLANPVVVSRDVDCDGAPGDEAVWVIVRRDGRTYYDRDGDEENANPAAGIRGFGCGPNNLAGYWVNDQLDPGIASRGFWEYTQHIQVYDDVDPVVSVSTFSPFCSYNDTDCTAPVSVNFSVFENCRPEADASLPADVTIQVWLDLEADGVNDSDVTAQALSGSYPDYNLFGTYPLGSHRFVVGAFDGCGNQTLQFIPFEVADCKAPAPVCLNGLSVNLVQLPAGTDADGDGDEDYAAITVAADAFISSAVNDCNGPVYYSINRPGETPDPARDSLVITCDDDNPVLVNVYAWDNADNPYAMQPDGGVGGPNYAFCETYALVLNAGDACQPPLGPEWIMGMVTNEAYVPMEGAMVYLSGQTDGQMATLADGTYYFANLEQGYDFTVAPELDTNDINGVSTLDLIHIERHILGIEPLGSPYKLIAADANRSNFISVADLIQIRRLVLGQDTVFPDNTSWRFVEEAFVFPDPDNPWATYIPEAINVNNLTGDVTEADFIGIKTGDVTLNAQTVNAQAVDERNSPAPFTFIVRDQAFGTGNRVTAALELPEGADPLGYQFTLRFDPDVLEWEGLSGGNWQAANLGLHRAAAGVITVSWDRYSAGQRDTLVAALQFRARRAGMLSAALHIAERPTAAEAYFDNGDIRPVELGFGEAEPGPAVIVFPNPFREQMQVRFDLTAASEVALEVYDSRGIVLWRTRRYMDAGKQAIPVRLDRSTAGEVLWLRLKTGTQEVVRRIVQME